MFDNSRRPPYGAAALVATGVLAIYVITLAPTVTFWDAGEFIAAARTLGIPHPPGTPLFVLLGNVWGALVPIGEFAWRTNLMTAVFSAAGSGLWFLIVWTAVGEEHPRLRWSASVAGAMLCAFTFTVWQNSNETEVYMVATFTIALVSWLAIRWRDLRQTPRASHLVVLIIYLQALSVGNHLLALLVGPAIIAFVFHELRIHPASDQAVRQQEWSHWAVLASAWAVLIAIGLGSVVLLVSTGVLALVALVNAATRRGAAFATWVVGALVVGVSVYAVLYVRAGLDPMINEADPSTLDALLAVIRREQYPPRTPFDNPIFPSGPDNPGRTIGIIWLQILNYVQYFDWQWARSIDWANPVPAFTRLPITMVFASLGVYGLLELHRRDRGAFWLLFVLWLVTGFGLVAYMNFKPGFSLAWDRYTDISMHEVRERDYFFVVSFLTWGLFAGFGLLSLARWIRSWGDGAWARRGASAVFALAAVPLVINFSAASRRHGGDAELARDFAFDLLQSVEPHGILFTNADNDTFPLWYLQEVEGVRRDVSVVNLSLANTRWYVRQLRDRVPRPFDAAAALERYRALAAPGALPPLHDLPDAAVDRLVPHYTPRAVEYRAGPVAFTIPRGDVLQISDQVALVLVQRNWSTRPIYWALTAGTHAWRYFADWIVHEGLVFRLDPDRPVGDIPPETVSPLGTAFDVERTQWLSDSVYRYGGLLDGPPEDLEPTAAGIAQNLAFPYLGLIGAYETQGDVDRLIGALERYLQLRPEPRLEAYLAALRSRVPDSALPPDTASPPTVEPR